jgi:hypothetical protein
MADLQVMCINKDDRLNPYERILGIGGGTILTPWRKSQQEAIRDIESGANSFYVGTGLMRARVVVATSPHGNKYIKTEADGREPNNLLSLPECG